MAGIKAVVFDWDGTVVDTMTSKIRNCGQLFEQTFRCSPERVSESYRKHSGIPRRELFEAIARDTLGRGLSEQEFSTLSNSFTAMNITTYSHSDEVLDADTHSALLRLREEHYLLFVSSSATQEEIGAGAKSLGIDGLFEAILGSRAGFRKGKEHIEFIRKQYGLETSAILFVGDEKADMRLAGRLGLRVVGLARDKSKESLSEEFADHVISELPELHDVLSQLG